MTATVTHVRRRPFGLERVVYAIRCGVCRWHTEVADPHIAIHISRLHTCQEQG